MGWQDAPVVQPSPNGGSKWQNAPIAIPPPQEKSVSGSLGSMVSSFETGLGDPVYGAAQDIGKVLPIPVHTDKGWEPRAQFDKEKLESREADYNKQRSEAGRSGFDAPRAIGAALNPLNYIPVAKGASIAGKVASSGALASALEPVIHGDFWHEKGKQIAEGATAGAVLGKAGKMAGDAINPALKGAQRMLSDAGVTMTPGQMAGGIVRHAEEIAKKFPILGSFIRGGEKRSVESFNKATINQALEPIGAKLPKGVDAGHDAVEFGQKALSDKYDTLLPKLNFQRDFKYQADIANLRSMAKEMPPGFADQFENILQNRVDKRMPTNTMDGKTMKQVESELNTLATPYKSSSDAGQRQLGYALDEVRNTLRDAVARQNPKYAKELSDVNSAYAMFTRVENAASRRAGSHGVFTPSDLLQAVKSGDKSVRKRGFGRGDALLQDWAEAAHTVLPSKVPDSGTAERAGYFGGAAGLGAVFHNPAIPIAAGAASLPYTKAGMDALQGLAQGVAAPVAGAARKTGQYAAPSASAIMQQLGQPDAQ